VDQVKAFKVTPFASGSSGLDRLVKQVQSIPAQRIRAAMATSGAPQQGALDSCLNFIERITGLSPDSPGADSIPEALEICWRTYEWLQQWVMANPIVAKDPGKWTTVSYQAYLEEVRE
jgi:hypothetical protein